MKRILVILTFVAVWLLQACGSSPDLTELTKQSIAATQQDLRLLSDAISGGEIRNVQILKKYADVIVQQKPEGLGAPVYGKLDQDIASAMMSINAVKGVEIGAGFDTALMTGEENADEIRVDDNGAPQFLSNHAGGILGGISSGQPVVARFVVKPTSSILTPRKTINIEGGETEIFTKGRHDPCVGIRAVPVGEAMMAMVIAGHYLLHRGQQGVARA